MFSGIDVSEQYPHDDILFTDTPERLIDNNERTQNGKLVGHMP